MIIKCVIFDLDGTLTEPMLDFDQIRQQIGLPVGIGVLEGMNQLSPEQKRRAEKILLEHEDHAAQNSKLNKGAKEVIGTLRQRGIAIGLLTRNLRKNVDLVAAIHGLHFDAIIDRTDGPAKPDSFGVLQLCRQFNVRPDETLVVGDFRHDLQSAKDAGAIPVLIRTHSNADDFAHLADFTIDRLDELLSIIDSKQ